MKKLIYIALTILLLATAKISLADKGSVDVTQFDIAGVKLGMTMEQAVAALTTSLKIDKSQLDYEQLASSSWTMTAKQKRIQQILGKGQVSYFSFKSATAAYTVSFEPDVLNGNNKQLVVSKVSYSVPRSAANAKLMAELIQKKYTKPSARVGSMILWCASPQVGSCFYDKIPQPKLTWDTEILSISLTDGRYEQAIESYLNK